MSMRGGIQCVEQDARLIFHEHGQVGRRRHVYSAALDSAALDSAERTVVTGSRC